MREQRAEGQLEAVTRLRQDRQHAKVPEEDDEQRRDVAEHLDIDGADLADQPVARQAPDADDEADQRGGDDADHRDQQRVDQADLERTDVGRIRRIGDQRLADIEAGTFVQETEGDRAAVGGKIGQRIADNPGDEGEQTKKDDRLEEDAAHDGVVDKRPLVGFRASQNLISRHPEPSLPDWSKGARAPLDTPVQTISGSAGRIAVHPSTTGHSGHGRS